MSNSAGLSTVSKLVKQTSLLNNHEYISAKEGLVFAETAVKTTRLTYTSQQNKLDNSFRRNTLSKDDYDKQTNQLKSQYEMDCAPWEVYIKKLTELVQQYSSQTDSQQKNKRILKPSPTTNKRTRITFPSSSSSSSSSDSDTPEPTPSTTVQKKPNPVTVKYDSSTNTEPLEFSLRSSFPSTPNIIPFIAQTNRIIHRVPLQHINEVAAKQIVLLHDEGQIVRWNDVIFRILTHFHVQDLGNLGIQRADQIACIDNLIRTQNKINTYLDAYTYWQTMGTLNELENDLARIFYKTDYNELLMGPIEKQPKIQELFRLNNHLNEPVKKDLKSSDILKYLDQYMTKEYAWKSENEIKLEDFLIFITKQIQVKNISQLGIRMKSVYLARNCIKSMQANQRKTMEIARTELNEMLTTLVKTEIEKIFKTIQNNQQRMIYASMEPIDIINDLMENCRELCQSFSSFRKLSTALELILKDPLLKNIFQLAICHGQLTPPKQFVEKSNKKVYFNSSDSEDEVEIPVKPKSPEAVVNHHRNENEIIQAFKEQIGSIKIITFNVLSRVEQRLCEKFQVTHFHELGHGNFNHFIEQNESAFFPVDTKFTLSSSECNNTIPTNVIPFGDLEHFILQGSNQENIEEMICYHYQVESFQQLGHGSFHSVLNSIKQNKKVIHTSVHYECMMLDDISALTKQTSKSISEDLEKQALDSINQCPLLENIHSYTQWNLYFRPLLGKLKSFLTRHSISTLEIDSNTFVKLSSNSTLDLLKESLYNYNPILTSGHLVSLLVQYGSLHNAPLSLLSNMMHTFLSSTLLDNRLYDFIIRILLRIPYLLLSSIIQQLFLDPLIKTEGSQIKVREIMWATIDKQNPDILTRFIQLGEQLGFTEWSINNIKIELSCTIQQEKVLPISTSVTVTSSIVPKVERTFSSKNPYDLIEEIRREKFGIGLNLSNESQSLTNQLKSLVGRSLERLSKELYNTDMHFVLELIQNADDNQYNSHAKPSLMFVIDSNSINIYNNEIGFEENNIQALCDIGKSTKGKHKQGYIGQKGIGFKSVFTVCDRPEIYSNGYRICFDAQNGSIGYILPNWINDEIRDSEYLNWSTRICLPLKCDNDMQKHKSRSLKESFHDIHPSLLLFLNRLRLITIHNHLTNSKQVYERIDIPGSNIIEIHCGENIEKWFVLKNQVKIPNDEEIKVTEIALAFPLHEIKTNEKIFLTKQDVFAYLPLRTFGFTFIIQADFEVPSSRQDILSNSIWNQYLLNEIPSLFLSSLHAFHQEQSSLSVDPLRLFLNFLPNETSIFTNNLFTPVCRQILHSLRSYRFLPVINDTNLHMPNECVLVNDLTIKEILTPELLYNYLQLYYLKDDLYDYKKELYELGVHCLDNNELIDIIKRMLISDIKFDNKEILSKWFSCLYRCLNKISLIDEENLLKQIKFLKIFPLKNHQELISLNNIKQTIFFSTINIHLPKLIENDLMIIDDDLWRNSPDITQIQILLERLGIQRLTYRNICEQHIFTIFENEHLWKEKSSEVLVSYVMFIFDLWSKQKHYMDISRLKSIVQLLTNDSFKQPLHHSIHFTPKYGNRYDLLKDFNGPNWILLSDKYIHEITTSSDRKKLREFFLQLGVSDFLFPINNSTYEQFNSLINIQSITLNKKLFLALQETWSTVNNNELFLKHIQESIWIPTISNSYSYDEQTNQIQLNQIHQFSRPNSVYMKTKQIERIFGSHVPYIDVEIDSNSSFANDLSLIQHITLSDVISMLSHWCEYPVFYTSISHIQHVYEYIYQNMSINELRELINTRPIFFIPMDNSQITRGRFVDISKVCWNDPTNLFDKYSSNNRFILEPYYAEQKSIFLDIFAVPLHPAIDEYINLLVHISSQQTTEETVQDAFLIFKTLGKWYEQSNNLITKQELQIKFSHKSVFPTKDHRWISLDDNPLVSDDEDLAQLSTQIPLIDISSSDVLTFFNICEIKSLSTSITIECLTENPSNGISIADLLSPLIPYIQLFMKSRSEFSDAYQWTKSINMSSILCNIQFLIVDHLQLIYRYTFDSSICLIREENSFYDKNQMIFYVNREWIDQSKYYRDIFHSFARLFIPNFNKELIRSLANFLCLLYNEDENNLEIFAKYQQFDLELNDSDDIPWKISSTSKPVKRLETKIDENKVRTLLENVAQNQEQYHTYKQKKRQELKKNLSETSMITTSDTLTRFNNIHSGSFPSIVETPYENVGDVKSFNIEDLTHQVLDNRDSAIGSNQESLEKIGEQWVNEYLHSKYHEKIQSDEIEIIWLNENLEQGKPYDFIIKNHLSKTVTYIEVKSTISTNRQLIPITYNELQYCCSLSDINQDFHIYRIYNTGQLKKVQLRIVKNIEEKLRKHALELFLLI